MGGGRRRRSRSCLRSRSRSQAAPWLGARAAAQRCTARPQSRLPRPGRAAGCWAQGRGTSKRRIWATRPMPCTARARTCPTVGTCGRLPRARRGTTRARCAFTRAIRRRCSGASGRSLGLGTKGTTSAARCRSRQMAVSSQLAHPKRTRTLLRSAAMSRCTSGRAHLGTREPSTVAARRWKAT